MQLEVIGINDGPWKDSQDRSRTAPRTGPGTSPGTSPGTGPGTGPGTASAPVPGAGTSPGTGPGTLEAGNTTEVEADTTASALLLKHEFLDKGADDVTLATLGKVLLEPTLTTLGNFLVRSNSQSSVASLRLPVPAGHGLQLGDVRQRSRQRLRGRHRHLPRHALAGCLEHGAPGLLGAAGRSRKAALRSLRWVDPRAGAAVGGHAGPVQHADQGLGLRGSVSVTAAGRLAGPHGLGHAGRAHRAGQRGLRPAAVQRRELHRCVHDGRGRLGRHFLRSAHSHRYCGLRLRRGTRIRELPEEHEVLRRWCEALGQQYRGQRLAGLAHEIFLLLRRNKRCPAEWRGPVLPVLVLDRSQDRS